MNNKRYVLILLYRNGEVQSMTFDTMAAALNYNMHIDMHLGADAIDLYKSFIETIPKIV